MAMTGTARCGRLTNSAGTVTDTYDYDESATLSVRNRLNTETIICSPGEQYNQPSASITTARGV